MSSQSAAFGKPYAFILLLTIFLCGFRAAMAQDTGKQPLYLLLDQSKFTVTDPKIAIDFEGTAKKMSGIRYNIMSPCIDPKVHKSSVRFIRMVQDAGTILTSRELKLLKVISLSELVKMVCANGDREFDSRYNVYFIEPINNYFACNFVRLTHPGAIEDMVKVTPPKTTSGNPL